MKWIDKNERLPEVDMHTNKSRSVIIWSTVYNVFILEYFVYVDVDTVEPSSIAWHEFSHWMEIEAPTGEAE